jgi:hypothetical protein
MEVPHMRPSSDLPAPITRDEVIARARAWHRRRVLYSSADHYQGYRQDCSGFVSYSWRLSPPGQTTDTLIVVADPIDKLVL